MELDGEKWEGFVFDSFDGAVVDVFEVDFPVFWDRFFVDGKAVILRSDVAAFVFEIDAGLIL